MSSEGNQVICSPSHCAIESEMGILNSNRTTGINQGCPGRSVTVAQWLFRILRTDDYNESLILSSPM